MASDKIRVGVVGVGGLARSVHLPSLAEIEDVEVVAACDLRPERAAIAKDKFGIPKTYGWHTEMLAQEKLDAVFVLVEPHNLFEVTRDCLDADLDVYMEKPPGITAFQAEALMRRAQSKNRILQVGFNRRYIPVVQRTMEIMKELTPITQVEGCFLKNGAASFFGGSVSSFVSDSIHAVDLMRWMAGGTPVKCAIIQGQVEDEVPNSWNGVVGFDNGVTGIIKANYKTGGRIHTFEMHGPNASAFINLGFGAMNVKAEILIHSGKAMYSATAQGVQDQKHIVLDGFELAGSDKMYRYYGFYQEDKAFIDSVRTRTKPLSDISEGVKSIQLVEMLLASAI
ncbi:MAG: Gfo/Idh/MocA family protein [Limnochordia bacterium]